MKITITIDTEYKSVTDRPTIPLSVQLSSVGYEEKLYIHPKAPIALNRLKHEVFKSPFAPIDYFGWDWRYVEGKPKSKHYLNINTVIFFSYKDLELAFADNEEYRKYVLPYLSRTRRISNQRSISLPYEVNMPDEKGKFRWHKVTLNVLDICAMQGSAGLNEYASNVDIVMEDKDNYTSVEKKDMILQYLDDYIRFENYALGDVRDCLLQKIMSNTIDKYNQIAQLIGVQPRNDWGMSTGKIVASIVTEWLSNQIEVPYEQFYKLTSLAGSSGITNLSKTVKIKPLLYLAMVDGGRCVAERDPWIVREIKDEWIKNTTENKKLKGFTKGVLIDIDISGCYGNGLKNQIYAIGNPTIIQNPMSLRDWLKKYSKELIPGLWTVRASYKNAPFKQDLLISKEEGAFTTWDLGVEGDSEGFLIEDGKRVYDASMVLTTESITHAALTHDLLQALKNTASNQEWSWLLDNMIIESSAIYMKKHRKDKVSKAMLKGTNLSELSNVVVAGTKDWVGIPLEPLVSKLIKERSKYAKKTPMNVFIKLIINTIYGCIASEFFSEVGTGISNAVIGSNITARARTLAWCMAKGLHTYMSITDGGVFDVNRVNQFKRKSLNLLESLHRDNTQASDRTRFVEQVPLMETEINNEHLAKCVMSKAADGTDQTFVDLKAWNHLKEQFGDLDIFNYDQFKFESKNWYVGFTLHSKADYRLIDIEGKETIALRGMPKVWSDEKGKKITDPRANELFDAIENNTPIRLDIADTQLLSQKDWLTRSDKDLLLPHDEVSDLKRFFSHTPLASRYKDMEEYKKLIKWYDRAKETNDPNRVAEVSIQSLYEE